MKAITKTKAGEPTKGVAELVLFSFSLSFTFLCSLGLLLFRTGLATKNRYYFTRESSGGINIQTAEEISNGQKFTRKFDGINCSAKNLHLKKFSAPLGFKKDDFEKFSRALLFEYL